MRGGDHRRRDLARGQRQQQQAGRSPRSRGGRAADRPAGKIPSRTCTRRTASTSAADSAIVRSRSRSIGQEGRGVAALVPVERRERSRGRDDSSARLGGELQAKRCPPEVSQNSVADARRRRTAHGPARRRLLPRGCRSPGRQPAQPPGRERGERQIGEEQPAPAEMRHDEPADHRPADARGGEHQREIALEPDALDRRHQLADERLRQHHQPAAAESLEHARRDELRQGLRERRRRASPA